MQMNGLRCNEDAIKYQSWLHNKNRPQSQLSEIGNLNLQLPTSNLKLPTSKNRPYTRPGSMYGFYTGAHFVFKA